MAKNYTKEEILEAIKGSNGIVYAVSSKLKCQWHTAQKYIEKYNDTKQAFQNEKEMGLDFTESMLFKRIQEGSDSMIKYHLDNQGKKRGYGQKQEIDLGDIDLKIIVE